MQHEAVASLCHNAMLRQGLLVPEETMANAALQPSAIEFPTDDCNGQLIV